MSGENVYHRHRHGTREQRKNALVQYLKNRNTEIVGGAYKITLEECRKIMWEMFKNNLPQEATDFMVDDLILHDDISSERTARGKYMITIVVEEKHFCEVVEGSRR